MNQLYQSRLKRLREYMSHQKIEVAFVTSPTNIYYYTGFLSDPHERFFSLVIDNREEKASLFVPALDLDAAKAVSYVHSMIPVQDSEDPYELLKREIGPAPISFGLEKKAFHLFQYEQLHDRFPQADYLEIDSFIESERLIKTEDDVRGVRRAVEAIEEVLKRGIEKVTVGMTELEFTAELEYQMRALGTDGPAFSTIVLSGARAALPHGRPGTKKIETGDFLLIDMGVIVDGYCSDITRTFLMGEGTEQQVNIYETVLQAEQKAIDAVKVGKPIGSVDQAARDHIKACGYGQYFNNRVGHGLGLEVHEAPSVHEENQLEICPGLLFTIEPGIYIPDMGGVRIEDDVYVNQEGKVKVLTSYPKELQRL
jgi:Xaa-Pro dipeptidase